MPMGRDMTERPPAVPSDEGEWAIGGPWPMRFVAACLVALMTGCGPQLTPRPTLTAPTAAGSMALPPAWTSTVSSSRSTSTPTPTPTPNSVPVTLTAAAHPIPTAPRITSTAVATPDPAALARIEVKERSSVSPRVEEMRYRVQLAQSMNYETGSPRLTIFDTTLTRDEDHLQLTLDGGPTYEAAEGFLTDGANGLIIINLSSEFGGSETGYPESLAFFERPPGSPGPVDLAGSEIDSLELKLDTIAIGKAQPGTPHNIYIHGYLVVKGTRAAAPASPTVLVHAATAWPGCQVWTDQTGVELLPGPFPQPGRALPTMEPGVKYETGLLYPTYFELIRDGLSAGWADYRWVALHREGDRCLQQPQYQGPITTFQSHCFLQVKASAAGTDESIDRFAPGMRYVVISGSQTGGSYGSCLGPDGPCFTLPAEAVELMGDCSWVQQ